MPFWPPFLGGGRAIHQKQDERKIKLISLLFYRFI
jgi:hypothetical protein